MITVSECLLRRRLTVQFPTVMVIGIFLFMIGGIVSSSFAQLPFLSILALIKYLYLIVGWFWLGTVLLQEREHIEKAVTLWITSAALSGLTAIVQLFWEDIIPGTSPAWGRMTGLTEHVNDLGGLTSVALIPAIMMVTRHQKTTLRIFFAWICIVLIAAGLFLSVSMTGVVALLFSLLVWLALNRFTFKKFLILAISLQINQIRCLK